MNLQGVLNTCRCKWICTFSVWVFLGQYIFANWQILIGHHEAAKATKEWLKIILNSYFYFELFKIWLIPNIYSTMQVLNFVLMTQLQTL